MAFAWMRQTLSPREDYRRSYDPPWADAGDTLPENSALWRQFGLLVELYKFYLDIAWKASVWFYAVSGGVLVYFFDNVTAEAASPYLRWLLAFIAAVSAAFGFFFLHAIPQLLELRRWLEYIAVELRLPGRPHVEFGARFLLFNGVIYCAAVFALIYLIVAAAE